jgi:hypothetical protein
MKANTNKKNVTASRCPACGYEVDSATAADGSDDEPAVGDYTICFRCRRVLKFGYDFQLERLTNDEFAKFKQDMLEPNEESEKQ